MKVFTIANMNPEQLAYAFARYSRSAMSFEETVKTVTADKAAGFMDKFYHNYSHASIGDMAKLPVCIEGVSFLAAIEIEQERLWDGQERSSRYQDFSESGYYQPDFEHLDATEAELGYITAIESSFSSYKQLTEELMDYMTDYCQANLPTHLNSFQVRALQARVFDIARGLLPYATLTSLGQITSARALEKQIGRLNGSRYEEVRDVAAAIKMAAIQATPLMPDGQPWKLVSGDSEENLRYEAVEVGPLAPTLVKYDRGTEQQTECRKAVKKFIETHFPYVATEASSAVNLFAPRRLDVMTETCATLLYRNWHFSFNQCVQLVDIMDLPSMHRLYDLAFEFRGPHDEWLDEARGGYPLIFDVLMDGKGMQDLYRHRNMVQIRQDLTEGHGFDDAHNWFKMGLPKGLEFDDRLKQIARRYHEALDWSGKFHYELIKHQTPTLADYILPVAFKRRSLFKMDYAQAAYLIETRSQKQGHFSYRSVANLMYRQLQQKFPALAKNIRVVDFNTGRDLQGYLAR